jgi:hypothetical protein
MPFYRCLFRDEDNEVLRLERAEHSDDVEALVWGADLLRHHSEYPHCEIWQADRLVHRL